MPKYVIRYDDGKKGQYERKAPWYIQPAQGTSNSGFAYWLTDKREEALIVDTKSHGELIRTNFISETNITEAGEVYIEQIGKTLSAGDLTHIMSLDGNYVEYASALINDNMTVRTTTIRRRALRLTIDEVEVISNCFGGGMPGYWGNPQRIRVYEVVKL
tara:strand:- start:37408 stop:37884 length:477 start_codon:yes stop_codon:yes gene_type:complete